MNGTAILLIDFQYRKPLKSNKNENISLPIVNHLPATDADNLCQQFGPRSGPTECPAWSGPNLFGTLMIFLKEIFENNNFETRSADDKKAGKISQHRKS